MTVFNIRTVRLQSGEQFRDVKEVDLEPLDDDDWTTIREMITRHVQFTNSSYAKAILSTLASRPFVKVMPRDYKRVQAAEAAARAEGRDVGFAELVGAQG